MRKKTVSLEEESRDARYQIFKLVNRGFSESHALARVFPGDPDRRRRLRIWQQQGLWPIPAHELDQLGPGEATEENESAPESVENPPAHVLSIAGMTDPNKMEERISDIVQREISRVFANVAVSPMPKTGKKGRRAIKKAFTVPSDLWIQIEDMFPGEIMSNVISAALRLYVNSKKEVDQGNGLKD